MSDPENDPVLEPSNIPAFLAACWRIKEVGVRASSGGRGWGHTVDWQGSRAHHRHLWSIGAWGSACSMTPRVAGRDPGQVPRPLGSRRGTVQPSKFRTELSLEMETATSPNAFGIRTHTRMGDPC